MNDASKQRQGRSWWRALNLYTSTHGEVIPDGFVPPERDETPTPSALQRAQWMRGWYVAVGDEMRGPFDTRAQANEYAYRLQGVCYGGWPVISFPVDGGRIWDDIVEQLGDQNNPDTCAQISDIPSPKSGDLLDLENRIGTVVAQWAHERFGWRPLAFFFREADAPEEMEEC